MTRLPIALIAAALLAAGCGGDDNEPTAQTGEATTAQTEAQPSPTTGEETTEDRGRDRSEERRDDGGDGGSSEPGPRAGSEQLERAVKSCKDNVRQAPQLSDDAKDDLVELCEQAASGDPEELRRVSREVCKRIITDTLPEGEQREQALELCDQSGSGK